MLLNEHVAQFQDLFDQAAIGMATMTVSGTIVRANRALADMMSCRPYDLVGVDYGRLMAGEGDKLDRGLQSITLYGRDMAPIEHPLPPRADGSPGPTVRLTLAPIRDVHRQVLYVFAPGAGHQRAARRRGRPARHRGEFPAAGVGRR